MYLTKFRNKIVSFSPWTNFSTPMRARGPSWIPLTDAECKTLSFASLPVDLMNNSGTHTHASNTKQESAVIFL